MDINDSPNEAKFRAEVKAWLADNATPKTDGVAVKGKLSEAEQLAEAKRWQKKIYDAGWACITWPEAFGGRGGTEMEKVIWRQEVAKYDELEGYFTIGEGNCGPALMAFASAEQKQRYLPALAAGEEIWCQLFSEPSAGSDVSAVKTKAERHGDKWLINGQKVWISGAHFSDYGVVLCRTDPTVRKHKGLTMFFIDMKQAGVDVQRIKQADGGQHFNEVFFNNAEIPDSQRLGEINGGWKGVLTVLMSERLAVGNISPTGFPEFLELVQELEVPKQSGTERCLAIDDDGIRNQLADWYVKHAGLQHNNSRILSVISRGEAPGPEASLGKLVGAPMNQNINSYAVQLLGLQGIVSDPKLAQREAYYQRAMLFSPANRLAGGTDEVMRNIIAEQVLGMPQDVRADKNLPFNEIPTGNA